MKNSTLIIASLLLLSSTDLYAVELMRYGFSFGSVEQNGDVRMNGNTKGRFEPNGDIRVGGALGGRIELDGSIRKGNKIVGNVDADGYVRVEGTIKGRIGPNGDVIETSGVIGNARGLDKRKTAVIYFFNIF
jgi:cytoskeletal protein CcmA (bactofilin family)